MDEVRIRPEVQTLVDRGNVTADEVIELRCNSWEWEAIIPVMNDQAFIARVEHALHNCSPGTRPFPSYNESMIGLMAPELLRRFKVVASIEKQACGSVGTERERGHDGPHGCGHPSAPDELWAVRIWPDWKIVETFATEKKAREFRNSSNYRVDGPYRLAPAIPEVSGILYAIGGKPHVHTSDALTAACKNIGFDLTCAMCAMQFFTGYSAPTGRHDLIVDEHDPACKTVSREEKK